MDGVFATMRRLHERGPRSRGLSVDTEGVAPKNFGNALPRAALNAPFEDGALQTDRS
jgi:hypothetical protein